MTGLIVVAGTHDTVPHRRIIPMHSLATDRLEQLRRGEDEQLAQRQHLSHRVGERRHLPLHTLQGNRFSIVRLLAKTREDG